MHHRSIPGNGADYTADTPNMKAERMEYHAEERYGDEHAALASTEQAAVAVALLGATDPVVGASERLY